MIKIRVGIEGGRRAVLDRAAGLRAPILVSANSMWNNRAKRFAGWERYSGFDTALDSGGFVAMMRYGGYRWQVSDYTALANAMAPSWWAQMDFCCEPEIAHDRSAVKKRIGMTVEYLRECVRLSQGPPPMPVIQGWEPSDYCSGPIHERGYEWPSLVGIGSVCRRQINGRNGVVSIVAALHEKVPIHVKFHLFGVKSGALTKLTQEFPERIASVDSMAWDMASRWDCIHAGVPRTQSLRAEGMASWYSNQVQKSACVEPQQVLNFSPQLTQRRAAYAACGMGVWNDEQLALLARGYPELFRDAGRCDRCGYIQPSCICEHKIFGA